MDWTLEVVVANSLLNSPQMQRGYGALPVTFFAVRGMYPMFLPHGGLGTEDARQLEQLERRSTYFLAIAAAVPLLGVAGATFIPPEDMPAVIIALRVLCVGSALAFIGVYWLFRMLEKDLAALQRIVSRG
ncbi:hypothetical protein ACLMAJ_18075 [Nocardia sp. KC 131]|uniref:hypothetical protein n=1 Tax=Nocardia arseniciresistens TaxID=3392119 RepID=UPI00398E5E05